MSLHLFFLSQGFPYSDRKLTNTQKKLGRTYTTVLCQHKRGRKSFCYFPLNISGRMRRVKGVGCADRERASRLREGNAGTTQDCHLACIGSLDLSRLSEVETHSAADPHLSPHLTIPTALKLGTSSVWSSLRDRRTMLARFLK